MLKLKIFYHFEMIIYLYYNQSNVIIIYLVYLYCKDCNDENTNDNKIINKNMQLKD